MPRPSSISRSAAVVAVALAPILTGACGTSGVTPTTPSVTGQPVFAVAASVRTTPAPQLADYVAAIDTTLALGARGIVQTWTWSALEADSAALNARKVIDDVRYARSRGLQVFAGIQIINTVRREVPSDLATLSWSDPRMLRRFERLLDALAPVLGDITYLSIGNEIGTYLGQSNEWPAYTTFFEQAAAAVKRRAPAIKVGATIEYDQAMSQSARARAIIALSDVAIFTHYPFAGVFTVSPPTVTRTTFDNMIQLAGSKPVVLQELGYPASALNGSSDAQQAEFFRDAIAQWKLRSARMPFVSLFLLHDLPSQQCADLGGYYNLPNQPAFTAFLCSLGLRRADGTARPAFAAVREATAWLRP